MPLIQLYNPIDDANIMAWFEQFVDYNFSDHQLVIHAIQAGGGPVIPLLAIGSITQDTIGTWALGHQSLHDATNSHFGIAGSDYTQIPFNDPSALRSMQQLHADEHRQWHDALGI